MFVVMFSCFGVSAFALLAGAVWAYFSQQRKMEGRVPATGTVVELAQTPSRRGYILCPVVEFTIPSEEKFRFTSEFGSNPARDKVGDIVNLRYDPADPQKAEVESTMSLWLTPLILGGMGLIACCLAVAFLGVYVYGFSSFSP